MSGTAALLLERDRDAILALVYTRPCETILMRKGARVQMMEAGNVADLVTPLGIRYGWPHPPGSTCRTRAAEMGAISLR